jgi:hypothetical protein
MQVLERPAIGDDRRGRCQTQLQRAGAATIHNAALRGMQPGNPTWPPLIARLDTMPVKERPDPAPI